MKRYTLLAIVVGSLTVAACYAALGYHAYLDGATLDQAKFFKDFIPLLAGLIAVILTAAFQRRISFLQTLRDLWKQMIPALQSLLTEAEKDTSDLDDYLAGLATWCGILDAVRGVFRNVRGLYPYEPLKDILPLYRQLDPRLNPPATPGRRREIKREITDLWKLVHTALLTEFDASKPTQPILYGYSTPKPKA